MYIYIKDLVSYNICQILNQGQQAMFPNRFNATFDSLSLKDIGKACNSPAEFLQFAKNVQIQPAQVNYEPIKKFIEKYPFKWVYPLRKLCMRLITQKSVITGLHVLFVEGISKYRCFYQALPIINSEAIPFKLDQRQSINYDYYCFEIYFNLGMYQKAYKKLDQIINDSSRKQSTRQIMKYVTPYLLLAKLLRKNFFRKQSIYAMLQSNLAFIERDEAQTLGGKRELDKKIEIQNLFKFVHGQKFEQEILSKTIGNSRLYLSIFQLCLQQKQDIRETVLSFIQDKLERVKTSEVLGADLKDPKTMKQINRFGEIAKYDCKNSILYLNHEKSNEKQVNELISKCYDLTQAIKQVKNIAPMMTKSILSDFSSIGALMRGMGGSGGRMGGMGGARGFGHMDDD